MITTIFILSTLLMFSIARILYLEQEKQTKEIQDLLDEIHQAFETRIDDLIKQLKEIHEKNRRQKN